VKLTSTVQRQFKSKAANKIFLKNPTYTHQKNQIWTENPKTQNQVMFSATSHTWASVSYKTCK